MFVDKFVSFRILDSLIGITSKSLLVTLSKYSRSSKFLFKEQDFICSKESEFGSTFVFWISLISRFLQSMKFSGLLLIDSAVNSLNLLNKNLRFGYGLGVNILLSFAYFPSEDSFISELFRA